MTTFGVTDAALAAAIEELQDLPGEELDELFTEKTDDLSDGHLVEYAEECVRHADEVERDRIKLDEHLWDANENKMRELQTKDDWQAKLTTNEPFQTVIQAKMLVRKAIVDQPEWINATTDMTDDPIAVMKAEFWQDALRWWAKRIKLTHLFPDMTEMAFSVGISVALKALWVTNQDGSEGIKPVKIEPWKIRRDVDAMSREPQSGLFCIHQDWVDYHVLLDGEKKGYYQNVSSALHDKGDEGSLDRNKERRKRGLVDRSHRFRPQVFVREFWGGVLDHNGEMVMPKVRFTVANRTVIARPKPVKFPRIKWPIHQFAAIPHMRNFHGYSLIEGMLKMWKFRNNLLSMTADKLSFVLNGAYEVDESKLMNPADKELYPGCTKAIRLGQKGAYSLIPSDGSFLPVIESMMAVTGNLFQNGVFVTELLKGETGQRKDITKGEVQIKTQQAMGVFEGIGRDVEYGAEQCIEMLQDVLTTYWDPSDTPSYYAVLGRKHAQILGMIASLSPEQRTEAIAQETDVEIRGVSIMFQKAELVDRLINMVKLTDSPRFAPYAKNDVLIRKMAGALDAGDAIRSEEEMDAMQQQQQAMQAAQQQAAALQAVMGGGGAEPGGQPMPPDDPADAPPHGSPLQPLAMEHT